MSRVHLILVCVSLAGCTPLKTAAAPADREMVLANGDSILVYPLPHRQSLLPESGDIPFIGSLQIRAGAGFRRDYTWDGETRSVDLWPRETRWLGSFGAYYPGPGSHWRSNHGITRGVLEEGQKHFDRVGDAQAWLDSKPYAVYSNDGLVVDFSKNSGADGTLSVDVWQILVNGQRPSMLKGSHDSLISISRKGR
jgi:hypothetical protein